MQGAIMHYINYMKTYLEQLQNLSEKSGGSLIQFFKLANIPTSTYYRAVNGIDLRLSTAQKVEDAIRIYTLDNTNDNNE